MVERPPQLTHQLGHYAGFFSRLLAFGIDAAIVALLSFLALASTRLLFDTFGLGCVTEFALRCDRAALPPLVEPIGVGLELAAPFIAATFTPLLIGLYIVFFWSLTGQTPGKAQLGVRIVRMDGELMTWRVALLRLIGYSLAIVPLFMGFVWILADDQRRGWHDRLAGTCVVYAWDAEPDERFLADALRSLQRSQGAIDKQ